MLTAHANQNLQKARESNDYQLFARALYGFQESLTLWDANHRARTLLTETQRDYATCALDKGDLDLAASLLGRAQSEAGRTCWPRSTRPAPSATRGSAGSAGRSRRSRRWWRPS